MTQREKLPRITDIDEEPTNNQAPVDLVKSLHVVWERAFIEWARTRGVWGDASMGYDAWDRMKPEQRAQLEEIWNTGHDRVTRKALGFPVDED